MIKEVILLASVKVKKDAKKGGYKAVLIAELGCDELQARKQKKKTVKVPVEYTTQRKAEAWAYNEAQKWEDVLKNGGAIPLDITFEEYSTLWIETHIKPFKKHNTIKTYEQTLKRLNKLLGKLRMKDIKPSHITKLYSQLKADGGSPLNTNLFNAVLSNIFDRAVKDELIEKNPYKLATKPKNPPSEKAAWLTVEEAQVMIDTLNACDKTEDFKLIVYTALYTGMRLGELCALEWSDVDFNKGTISINKTSVQLKGGHVFDNSPKTEDSNRTISMNDLLKTSLKAHRRTQTERKLMLGTAWLNSKDKVFTNENGAPLVPNTVSSAFSIWIRKNGLKKITFHDLRHTHASLLTASGFDPVTISKRMGHKKPSMTLDIYSHGYTNNDVEAARKFDELFG